MTVDCGYADNTNIDTIQLWTNSTTTGNNMVLNQSVNLFGSGISLIYNQTRRFNVPNLANGQYKWSCKVNDTANNNVMSGNFTYNINVAVISDTCTPPSINNNWLITDNCTLSTNTNLGLGNLTISCGSLILKANLYVNQRNMNRCGSYIAQHNGEFGWKIK